MPSRTTLVIEDAAAIRHSAGRIAAAGYEPIAAARGGDSSRFIAAPVFVPLSSPSI